MSSILVLGLLLRMYVATDLYVHEWDERYHALVAKNLIQHPLTPTLYENPVLSYNYKGWTTNHVWLHKQPVALWCMALSMKVFGVNEIALRLPSILFSVLGIWLTFQIALLLFGRKVAFIAACTLFMACLLNLQEAEYRLTILTLLFSSSSNWGCILVCLLQKKTANCPLLQLESP
ncbi:MAG: glycosyltransferase family 39 protein [Chitinophagales bacterium]